MVAAILPIVDGSPKPKICKTRKCPPLAPLPETCKYRHKTPPSYLPPPPPISHPCQQTESCPFPPSSTSPTFSSSSKHHTIHYTPTQLPFTRARSGVFYFVNLYIYLLLIILFFTKGVEAGGGKGGINSVFIGGLGGRVGAFTGRMFVNISLERTFVFPNTSEFEIQSEF